MVTLLRLTAAGPLAEAPRVVVPTGDDDGSPRA
jgi:hypothetical protein